MFNIDAVQKNVNNVADEMGISGESTMNANQIKELVARSLYRTLTSTDFLRATAKSIVNK